MFECYNDMNYSSNYETPTLNVSGITHNTKNANREYYVGKDAMAFIKFIGTLNGNVTKVKMIAK
jgi:hypothetical protein